STRCRSRASRQSGNSETGTPVPAKTCGGELPSLAAARFSFSRARSFNHWITTSFPGAALSTSCPGPPIRTSSPPPPLTVPSRAPVQAFVPLAPDQPLVPVPTVFGQPERAGRQPGGFHHVVARLGLNDQLVVGSLRAEDVQRGGQTHDGNAARTADNDDRVTVV